MLEKLEMNNLFEIVKGKGESKSTLRYPVMDELCKERKKFRKYVRETFSCGNLLEIIRDKVGSRPLDAYIQNFIQRDSDTTVQSFIDHPQKAAAFVISGESGSGKSTFVQNEFQSDDCACIYHSLNRNDTKVHQDALSSKPKNVGLYHKIREVLRVFEEKGLFRTELHDAVSDLHFDLFRVRNQASISILENILKGKMANERMVEWWNGKDEPIEKLVVTIDEVGKCENFARGLVDSVRHIHQKFIDKRRCKLFKLVLAGSGIDGTIQKDSSLPSEEFPDTATFGTDPAKANVVVLRGPAEMSGPLQDYLKSYFAKRKKTSNVEEAIPEAIVNGSISRVLATNTRMLFDGIIPILENEKMTKGIEVAGLKQRLIDLCSANIIMDYAARNYALLNALEGTDEDERQHFLSRSFLYLLQSHNKDLQELNHYAYAENVFANLSEKDKVELILKGVVASIPSERFDEQTAVSDELKSHFKCHTFVDVRDLSDRLRSTKDKLAIVMKQRVPSAQSADIIVLEATVDDTNRL
jgi:hypothetical protein